MSDEEIREQYELFALGLAEPEAAQEIEALLRNGDPDATQGVAMGRELAALIAQTAPDVQPPARLQRKIAASVRRETSGFPRWIWAWASATALLALLAFNFWQREQTKARELASMREEVLRQSAELATVNQVLEFLNEPQLRVTTFGPQQPAAPPRGRVLVSPARGVLLLVANLPPAAANRTYQMWVVPKQGNPVPAGLFQTTPDGRALHVRGGAVNLATTAAIAVSDEPASGSAAPTTTPFIIAPVTE